MANRKFLVGAIGATCLVLAVASALVRAQQSEGGGAGPALRPQVERWAACRRSLSRAGIKRHGTITAGNAMRLGQSSPAWQQMSDDRQADVPMDGRRSKLNEGCHP